MVTGAYKEKFKIICKTFWEDSYKFSAFKLLVLNIGFFYLKNTFVFFIFHTPHFPHPAFSTHSFSTPRIFHTLIFHTPHFPHSHFLHYAFSTPGIFHTLHFPHPTFSTLRIFHTPHFPHPVFSTLLISSTPHIFHTPHSVLSTLLTFDQTPSGSGLYNQSVYFVFIKLFKFVFELFHQFFSLFTGIILEVNNRVLVFRV